MVRNFVNANQNSLALIVVCIIVAGVAFCFCKRIKINHSILGKIYALFTLQKTVLGRTRTQSDFILEPLWSYRAWVNGEPGMFSQIYLNVMLFIPYGLLICCSLKQGTRKWIQPVVSGFLLSCSIEFLQLFLQRGTFEIDDIINNTLGAFIGVCVAVSIDVFWGKS